MTITIGLWIVPVIITLVIGAVMCRPYRSCGTYDFGFIFRLFWLIPICIVWMLYMATRLWTQ